MISVAAKDARAKSSAMDLTSTTVLSECSAVVSALIMRANSSRVLAVQSSARVAGLMSPMRAIVAQNPSMIRMVRRR